MQPHALLFSTAVLLAGVLAATPHHGVQLLKAKGVTNQLVCDPGDYSQSAMGAEVAISAGATYEVTATFIGKSSGQTRRASVYELKPPGGGSSPSSCEVTSNWRNIEHFENQSTTTINWLATSSRAFFVAWAPSPGLGRTGPPIPWHEPSSTVAASGTTLVFKMQGGGSAAREVHMKIRRLP